MTAKLIAVLCVTTTYAILRYVVFGGVSPVHLPVYILNKSIAMASVFFLLLVCINHRKGLNEKVRFWLNATLHGIYIHILLSLAILSRSYFPKFFGTEQLNFTGELTVFFGVITAYCFWRIRSQISNYARRRILLLYSAVFTSCHLIAMGFGGWLKVEDWHGGMPPVSLLSFIILAAGTLLILRNRKTSLLRS